MQLEFSSTTKQYFQVIDRVSNFLRQPAVLRILDTCPEIYQKGRGQLLSISFVGATRMKRLNMQYRKKLSSTDVLSFELHESGVMGELYICPDDIAKNAQMLGHAVDHELLEIMVHGILHVSGYDHSDSMFDWQKTLTERILIAYEHYSRTR